MDIKVQFVGKMGNEMFTIRANPTAVTLERGKAWEFEPFVVPQYSCTVDDKTVLLLDKKGFNETTNIPFRIKAATEVTSKLRDDIACEQQIVEQNFGVVFSSFAGNEDVSIKKVKEVDVTENSLDEFEKEVAMLDKFQFVEIVHFNSAYTIWNHVMMVTEFSPCGSLMDCAKRRLEPEPRIKVNVVLGASKEKSTTTPPVSSTATSNQTTSLSSRWTMSSTSTGS